jgi:hypothetical protein
MSSVRQQAASLAVLWCVSSLAAAGDLYRLLQLAATNEPGGIASPLLVDTSNHGFKLTNALLHLEALKPDGEPSGIRLGMTMEQVVAQWGRPLEIEPQWCMGGPCFFYADVMCHFGAGSNRVCAIWASNLPDLARTLPIWPTLEDCIRKLGQPSQRKDYAEGTHCSLVYETSRGRIKLVCAHGKLTDINWGPGQRE